MDFEKFTERSRGFVQAAQSLALNANHQQFTTEHLLKVLLDDPEGLAANLIRGTIKVKKLIAVSRRYLAREQPLLDSTGQFQLALNRL